LLDRIRDLHRQAALLGQAYDKSLDQVRASVSGMPKPTGRSTTCH